MCICGVCVGNGVGGGVGGGFGGGGVGGGGGFGGDGDTSELGNPSIHIYALAEVEMLGSAWLLFLEGTPEPAENIDHKLLKK